jgi:poly(A) polymerase
MFPKRLEPLLRADGVPMRMAARFAEAGHQLLLVGGSVRDALLGRIRPEAEFDFTTDASPDQIHDLLKGWARGVVTVGKEFGTIGGHLDEVAVEITTFRSERYRDDSRKPEVAFTADLEVDLSRRDFTVNAIALRLLPKPEMVDPFGGLVDLGKAVLRTPLPPEVSFGDDPLRMLRLFRFAATLGFKPDAAAVAAARAMADRLEIVSAERIREEFDRLIVGDHVEAALWGVVDTGLVARFLPELPALALAQDPHHRHKDVLAHTIAVVGKCPPDRIVRLGALFHDVGKPATKEIGRDGVTFHHHEVVGARLTRSRMKELRYANEDIDQVSELVYLHMRAHTFRLGWTDRAVRRYVRDAGPLLDRLNTLVRCDVTTANDRKARQIRNRVDELEERIADLRQREELDSIRPPLDGHQVMTYLGVKPGPIVGEALEMLLEHRLDHGPFSEEEAYAMLERWKKQRGDVAES